MRTKALLKLGTAALMSTALAACGSSSSLPTPTATTPPPTPTPTTASFQSMFGAAFAAIFDASAFSDTPIDPTDSSVPPLAPAADPLDN